MFIIIFSESLYNKVRIMSFKAVTDIVVSFQCLKTYAFRKQGSIRFRASLFCVDKKQKKKQVNKSEVAFSIKQTISESEFSFPCHPFSILRDQKISKKMANEQHTMKRQSVSRMMPLRPFFPSNQAPLPLHLVQKQQSSNLHSQQSESYLDHDHQYYYSKSYETRLNVENQLIHQSCFFRAYLETDKLENYQFFIKVELLFSQTHQDIYTCIGVFEATIHNLHGLFTYLPIVFDEFEGFTIEGAYNSTIMEYKFESSQHHFLNQKEDLENGHHFNSFEEYIEAVSHGFSKSKLKHFYEFYRHSLQKQLFCIQERHSDFLRILNISQNYGFVKISPNLSLYGQMESLLSESPLSGYETHKMRSRENSYVKIKETITDEVLKDFLSLKGIIYQKWNEYILFVNDNILMVVGYLKSIYDGHVKERYKTHVFSHRIESKFDWTFTRYEDSGKTEVRQAEKDKMKSKEQEMWRDAFPIESSQLFEDENKIIKIFQEVYEVHHLNMPYTQRTQQNSNFRKDSLDRNNSLDSMTNLSLSTINPNFEENRNMLPHHHIQSNSPKYLFHPNSQKYLIPNTIFKQEKIQVRGEHIIIFVHGYQASRQDFVLFKSCLQIKYRCRVFISSINEGRTEDSIETMGKRLAIELNNFFKNVEFTPGTRLSFIGHSMGGIIIRSALTYIKNIGQYLYTFMSFSSPHLGYLYQTSTLIQAGLWFLNAWQKSQSLEQLCMRDKQDPRKTFLYRLTENKSLNSFKQLVLISSSQDEYVPYESARISKNSKMLEDIGENLTNSIIKEMVDNLLAEVKCQQISRMNVVFNIEGKNFDTFVGRTAHVKYLSEHKFIKMFCTVFDKFFI